MTDLNLAHLRAIAEAATQGEWRLTNWAGNIVTDNAKIGGDALLFDIRGWGYFTGNGHGALGMSHEAAADQQKANGDFVVAFQPKAARNLLDRMESAEARAEKAEAALEDARASAFDEAAKMIESRLGVSSIAKQLIGALRAAAADTGARVAQGRK